MEKFIIPNALQIVIDDLGWFNGKDDRKNGGPSRTAMPRNHVAEDYIAVNELGRALGMKINCAFVLGEWDPDNRLKKLPHFSKYGDGWDNEKYLDREEMRRVVKAVNASEYIDLSIHGLMHGYYMDGVDDYDASDFCYKIKGKMHLIPEDEIRARLDAFFDILNYYGIKKKVNSYIPSTGYYMVNGIAKYMHEYGINYICQPCNASYPKIDFNGTEPPYLASVDCGTILTDRRNFIDQEGFNSLVDILPWDEWGSDFSALPKANCIVGTHWPNYLHIDPQKSVELVPQNAEYFKSSAERWGAIMSRDLGFYSTQALYKRFAKIEECGGCFTVDVTDVPKPVGNLGKFCVSSRDEIKNFDGCDIALYETRADHLVYEITPKSDSITLS